MEGDGQQVAVSLQCKGALRVALSYPPQPVYGIFLGIKFITYRAHGHRRPVCQVVPGRLVAASCQPSLCFFSLFSLIENTYDRSDGYEHGKLAELDEDE